MKNKGFTLVEMLAVIALLAIIGTITAVSVKNIKKNQDEENKLNIISAIMTGARNYITENNTPLSSNNRLTEDNYIYISDLRNGGYVDFDIEKYPEYYFNNEGAFNNYTITTSTTATDVLYKKRNIRWTYGKVCNNNSLKYEVIYDYFSKSTYKKEDDMAKISDCGCLEQSGRDKSFKLCENNTDGKTCGWDTNGIYSCTDGTTNPSKNLNEDKEKGRSN